MTYKELQEWLSTLNDEQLDCDISIYTSGEYYEVDAAVINDEQGVLDIGHPLIITKM